MNPATVLVVGLVLLSGCTRIIDIAGVLCRDAYWWDETEYGQIQREVAMALEDAEVSKELARAFRAL